MSAHVPVPTGGSVPPGTTQPASSETSSRTITSSPEPTTPLSLSALTPSGRDELSLFKASQPTERPPLLRCILYCEFDPHRGPRPVFQAPQGYVSSEVCDSLSDHLISSSDLCGRLVSVAAFGLRFVGHPQCILSEIYERNQLMFNVVFVFEQRTDPTPYSPLVKRLSDDFRQLEVEHSFLTGAETRPKIENLLQGVLHDVNTTGELLTPPTGCEDFLPVGSRKNMPVILQEVLPPAVPESVQQHEVPVLVASRQLLLKNTADPIPFLDAILPLLERDRFLSIKGIAREASMEIEEVIACVRSLLYAGVVRTIDVIVPTNVYVPTNKIRDLIKNQQLSQQCVAYCRPEGGGVTPLLRQVLDFLLSMQPGKSLRQVCCDQRMCTLGNCPYGQCQAKELPAEPIDVRRLITFARVHRFLRLVEHYPVYMGDLSNLPSMSRVLQLCDGQHALDSICCELDAEVEDARAEIEACSGVIIINRMSPAGSTVLNP